MSEDQNAGANWKWWYFLLAGFGIAGYSIWQSYDRHSARPLGSLFLAALCIGIGLVSRRKETKVN
jgi:hypothetical protein